VKEILQDLSEEECRVLGFDPKFGKPAWLVCTVVPVPPPHVRPSVAMNATQRCEDDITFQLTNIVKVGSWYRGFSSDIRYVLRICVDVLW
jgi:DNA-directed RNA polymerase II subunit RPB1